MYFGRAWMSSYGHIDHRGVVVFVLVLVSVLSGFGVGVL